MESCFLKTQTLCKDYQVGSQTVHALREVSIDIHKGEFVAVMGPSGSGKSTFMNLLGCLDTPSAGRYLFEGVEVSSLSPKERAHIRNRRVGFVFQNFNLLARTKAVDNVALPLRYGGIQRGDRLKLARQALESVGLADRTNHYPSQLSGGQQQRVAIARAMVNKPAIIMADEPTGALDTRTGAEVMAIFQDFNKKGITVVVVTHELEIANYAKRLIRFRDGRLVSDRNVEKPLDARQVLQTMPQAED